MVAAVVVPRIAGLCVIIAIEVECGWALGVAEDSDATPVMIEGVSVLVRLGTCTWFMGHTEVGNTVAVVDTVLLAANSPHATLSRMSCAYDSLSNWSNCSWGIQLWYRPPVCPPHHSDHLPRPGFMPCPSPRPRPRPRHSPLPFCPCPLAHSNLACRALCLVFSWTALWLV